MKPGRVRTSHNRHHEILACQQHVRRADDAIQGGLARAIAVVEEMLGHGIVDGDDRELKHPIRRHGAQTDDAGGGLFRAADDARQAVRGDPCGWWRPGQRRRPWSFAACGPAPR